MALTPELLEKAKKAGTDLDSAERDALLARAEYHTSVRRLHLAGASLREIAQALAISHQRVQQIVSGAGGSWWRRVWRTRTVRPDVVCTWCDRPPSEVAKLIAGPNVFICDACVQCAELAAKGRPGSGPFIRTQKRSASGRCSFCGKRRTRDRSLVPARAGQVCTECLRVCREILDGRAS
jgi:hypothetical protein